MIFCSILSSNRTFSIKQRKDVSISSKPTVLTYFLILPGDSTVLTRSIVIFYFKPTVRCRKSINCAFLEMISVSSILKYLKLLYLWRLVNNNKKWKWPECLATIPLFELLLKRFRSLALMICRKLPCNVAGPLLVKLISVLTKTLLLCIFQLFCLFWHKLLVNRKLKPELICADHWTKPSTARITRRVDSRRNRLKLQVTLDQKVIVVLRMAWKDHNFFYIILRNRLNFNFNKKFQAPKLINIFDQINWQNIKFVFFWKSILNHHLWFTI